jgi:integrase/recombinase XerD
MRVVLPSTGRVSWLLVDEDFVVHPECRGFVLALMALDRSTETVRAYVPRVGRFLNWCNASGVEWRRVGLADLARFKFHLEHTKTARGARSSGKSVNAVLIAVTEFLRFCARQVSGSSSIRAMSPWWRTRKSPNPNARKAASACSI